MDRFNTDSSIYESVNPVREVRICPKKFTPEYMSPSETIASTIITVMISSSKSWS